MPSSMPVAASGTASSKNPDVSDQHADTRGHRRSKFNGFGITPWIRTRWPTCSTASKPIA
ncbi:hypothetical protein, partial [Azospirillum sp.]|uniref:hypothetical protein n=1 Tax=Azospirillum sp. TaxID=34012 RepID=UPI0026063DAD